MKFKNDICYLAGLVRMPKKAKIEIKNNNEEITAKFINIAINNGIDPKKIIVEDNKVYFYNYRLANKIKRFLKNKRVMLSKPSPCSIAYFAGLFDSLGKDDISFSSLDTIDKIGLSNLNIHLADSRIINKKFFLTIILSDSIKAKEISKKLNLKI